MKLAIVNSAKELGERALFEVKQVLKNKPDAVIGFATGATPVALYDAMVRDRKKNGTDYSSVVALNLDEYVGVEAKAANSFASYMRVKLFDHINIQPENTFIPDGMAENLVDECARYAETVRKHRRDLQILGIGANGHIAFNEPFTRPEEPVHIAALTAQTRADAAENFGGTENVPTYGLTMGIEEILQAEKIILLALGEHKARAVYNMICGKDDMSCPATALRKHRDVTVILDKSAAELLRVDEWRNDNYIPQPSAAIQGAEDSDSDAHGKEHGHSEETFGAEAENVLAAAAADEDGGVSAEEKAVPQNGADGRDAEF